jgi:hypothetical protein
MTFSVADARSMLYALETLLIEVPSKTEAGALEGADAPCLLNGVGLLCRAARHELDRAAGNHDRVPERRS